MVGKGDELRGMEGVWEWHRSMEGHDMRAVNLLSVSGGKDSTAMLLLAVERGDAVSLVFADTGNEHAITYEYLDYLEGALDVQIRRVRADFSRRMLRKAETVDTKWRLEGIPGTVCDRAIEILHNPTGNPYLDLCILKGRFPATRSQFCTEELKVAPIYQQVINPILDACYNVTSWQGVRAAESRRRAGYSIDQRAAVHRTNGSELWLYRPLLHLSVDDVFAIHRRHGIDPNPLYKMGMNRVGCMPCINCRKGELLEIAKRFPEHIDKIREWEAIVGMVSKRGRSTFFVDDDGSLPGIDEVVQWAHTSHGGRQLDWINGLPSEGCMSAYGLCE